METETEIEDAIDAELRELEGKLGEADDQTAAEIEPLDEPEQSEVVDAPSEIPDDLKANSSWKEEARNAWDSLVGNVEQHGVLRQLSGQLNSDSQYRTQLEQERSELTQQAQLAQKFQQLAAQHGDLLRGQDPLGMASQLFYTAQQLQTNPQATLLGLAKQYGVDLNQASNEQPWVSDTERHMQSQIEGMQQHFQQQQMQQQKQQHQQLVENGRAFENETDANGNKLRPYVAEVAGDMIGLIKSGYVQSFQQAYDTACRLRDDVWQKMQAEQGKSNTQTRTAQAQRAKAAASAQPKSSKSQVTTPKGVEDLDGALDQAFNEQVA